MKQIIISLILAIGWISKVQAVTNPASGFFVDLRDNTVLGIIMKIINILLSIAGVIAVMFVIIGGMQYIFSGANEDLAEKGKKTLTNAIIGVVIIVLSFVIVNVVDNTFR